MSLSVKYFIKIHESLNYFEYVNVSAIVMRFKVTAVHSFYYEIIIANFHVNKTVNIVFANS